MGLYSLNSDLLLDAGIPSRIIINDIFQNEVHRSFQANFLEHQHNTVITTTSPMSYFSFDDIPTDTDMTFPFSSKFCEHSKKKKGFKRSRSKGLRSKRSSMYPLISVPKNSRFLPRIGIDRMDSSHKKRLKKAKIPPKEDKPPIIFVPEEKPKCIKTPRMSSFAFLSFAMAVGNIVINIANNVNNNLNNNNDNNNNNNNNDNNVNIANSNNNVNSGNEVMVGRRLERLLALQKKLSDHVIQSHNRTKRWTMNLKEQNATLCASYGDSFRARGLLAVGILVDLWHRLERELELEQHTCIGYRFCEASSVLSSNSNVGSIIGRVGLRAASHLWAEDTPYNPHYLEWAVDCGRRKSCFCSKAFHNCRHAVVVKNKNERAKMK